MKKPLVFLIIVAVVFVGWFVWRHQANAPTNTKGSQQSTGSTAMQSFNKKQYSVDDPTSIWVVVNKHRSLQPASYVPADLEVPNVPIRLSKTDDEMKMRKVAGDALEKLFAGAEKQGLHLQISSGYRSYTFQTNLYNHYVAVQGKTVADSQSARPGHSEHQTGLAVDVEPTSRKCEVEECFGTTPEGEWLAAHAYEFGFVIRYPQNMQNITGYIYEPWHIRYIGIAAATEMRKENVATLEQFFGLDAAPDYE